MRFLFVASLYSMMLALFLSSSALAIEPWVADLKMQAEKGDAFAQTTLGVCYELGEGIEKDEQAAVKWYSKAADQAWIGGIVRLGKCYAEGRAIPKNQGKAIELWQAALDLPVAKASVQETAQHEARAALAHAYRIGNGVSVDLTKAIAVALPAAEWGLPEAEYEIGMCYLAMSNKAKAKEYLERAKNGGFALAEKELSENLF